jgi:hypothetical protein
MHSRTLITASLLALVLASPALAASPEPATQEPSPLDRSARLAERALLDGLAIALRAAGHHALAYALLDAPVNGTHGLSDGPDPVGSTGDGTPPGSGHDDSSGAPGEESDDLLPVSGPGSSFTGIFQDEGLHRALRRASEQY